jgi:hypothetical protein
MEILFYLIAIVLFFYVLGLFIEYVLPWIIIVAIIVLIPGYALTRMLTTQRIQLSGAGALTLFLGVGTSAWVTTVLLVSLPDTTPWLALLVGPSAFFIQGLILLFTWRLCRIVSLYRQIHLVQRKLYQADRVVSSLEQGVNLIRSQMDSINQQYSKRIKDETQLGEQIKSLIAREPRSLGLIAQTESAKLATSGDADIKRNIKLQSSQPENLGDTLRMLLRRRELLRRDIATPITQKDTMTQNLETTQQKLASAQKKRNRIKDQVDQYQSINNNLWKRTIVM